MASGYFTPWHIRLLIDIIGIRIPWYTGLLKEFWARTNPALVSGVQIRTGEPERWWFMMRRLEIMNGQPFYPINNSIYKSFGGRVRLRREQAKISQMTLAVLSGLSRSSISEIESGVRNISLASIGKLARALGIPARELLPAKNAAERTAEVPRLVSAEDADWENECLDHARSGNDFILIAAQGEHLHFIKNAVSPFGYALVKYPNAIAMVALDRHGRKRRKRQRMPSRK